MIVRREREGDSSGAPGPARNTHTALGRLSRLSGHSSTEPPEIVIFKMPTDMFYRLMQPVNYIVHFIWRLFKKLGSLFNFLQGEKTLKKLFGIS